MSNRLIVGILLLAILLFAAASSVYTISEGQRGLLLRLGELSLDARTGKPKIIEPGLHFKLPFIVTVRRLDVRLQALDVEASRILTAEQKYVLVDYFAKWRVLDIPLYYKRTGGYPLQARMLLQQKINDALRAAFGRREIKEVISSERLDIMRLLQERADRSARDLGVQVTDVRIKGIDLPQEVRDSVFQRMRTEREQVATKHRSQGRAQSEAIKADADMAVTVMLAQAKKEAQHVRARGDAKAADIYTQAYQANPGFYAFYRSLEAYRQVFRDKRTLMLMKPDGAFFKYFTNTNKQQPLTQLSP